MARSRTNTILILAAANLAALTAVVLTWPAFAQPEPPIVRPADARARGDYTMVSGRIGAGGNHVVYVIDSANQEIIGLRWDSSKQVMLGVGYRSLANDARGNRGR